MIYDMLLTRQWRGCLAISLALAFGAPAPEAAEAPVEGPPQLSALVAEALAHNPEIAAARAEREPPAAGRAGWRIEDPMLELGIVNAPLDPSACGAKT